jgi:hypothetical protein
MKVGMDHGGTIGLNTERGMPFSAVFRTERNSYQLRGAETGGGPSPIAFFGFSVPT